MDTNLSRCDIEGALIHNSKFNSTDFKTADFRSNHVGWTVFTSCNFTDAFIINSDFDSCEFISCNFTSTIINTSNFKNCIFVDCKTNKGTFTFLDFSNTTFKNMTWGDCSFYKNIVDECRFDNVWINIDCLGQVYGIDANTVKQLHYIFLGRKYGTITEELYSKLPKIYIDRGWKFDYIFLRYNIGILSTYEMIMAVNNYFIDVLVSNQILKKDDIQFIIQVIDKLYSKHTLPLFAILESISILNNNIKELMLSYSQPELTDLKTYIFHLIQIAQEMMDEFFSKSDSQAYGSTELVTLKLHYDSGESLKWADVINDFFNGHKKFLPKQATLIRTEQGSIIEVILIALGSVFALQFLLYGINGVILQLLDLRAGITTLKKNQVPQTYIDRVLAGKQIQPEAYKDMVDIIRDNKTVKKVLKLAQKTKDVNVISGIIEASEEESQPTE